jgi:Protein of unknown function (DUF3352)
VSEYGEVFGALPAVEVLSSEGGAAEPTPRRRRTRWVAGISAVAVLAAAGAGYAAFSALSGGGSQPEDVLPAATIAFVKVDLDPSAGQKLELFKLLQRFPKSAELTSADTDFGDWLIRRLVESDATPDGIQFAKDIKPWLGQRFAVAAVSGGSSATGKGSVTPLVVLQESDQDAATAALNKLAAASKPSPLDYAFADGYVVVSPGSATAAHAAVAAAAVASLGQNSRYVADVASLNSDQVVTGWADAAKLGGLVKSQLGALSALGGAAAGGTAQLGSLVDSAYQGRWVLGAHAADGSIEVQFETLGGKVTPASPPVLAAMKNFLPDPVAALSVTGMGQRVDALWQQLSATPAYKTAVAQAQSELGLTLPGDLKTLLGEQLDVSVAGDLTSAPEWLAASTSANAGAAKAVLDKVLAGTGADPSVVAERVNTGTLYVGSSQQAVDSAGKASLADNPLFGRAVADPASAQLIAFVDLTKVWKALDSAAGADSLSAEEQELRAVAAVGLSERQGGGNSSFTLRVVFS